MRSSIKTSCTWGGAFFAALVVSALRVASAQIVGIYADSLATSCNLTIPFPGPAVDVYVVFVPGSETDSIGGASFRIDGLPPGWTAEAFPNPRASYLFGTPFDFVGVGIGFPSCQSDVVLFRLRITATSAVVDHAIHVLGANIVPETFCPRAFGCDGHPSAPLPQARALVNSSTTCIANTGSICPWTDVSESPQESTALCIVPNPMTLTTSINYRSAQGLLSGRIMVYDLHGRVIAQILQSGRLSQHQSVVWDGRDRAGHAVPAGIYIVQVETDAGHVAKKLVVVR